MWSFRTFLAQLRLFFSFCCSFLSRISSVFLSFDCYVFIPCIYSSVYVDFTDIEIKCLKACVSWKEMSQRRGSFVNLFLQSPYLPMENTFNSMNQHFLPPSFFLSKSLDNAIQDFSPAQPSWVMSNYIMRAHENELNRIVTFRLFFQTKVGKIYR